MAKNDDDIYAWLEGYGNEDPSAAGPSSAPMQPLDASPDNESAGVSSGDRDSADFASAPWLTTAKHGTGSKTPSPRTESGPHPPPPPKPQDGATPRPPAQQRSFASPEPARPTLALRLIQQFFRLRTILFVLGAIALVAITSLNDESISLNTLLPGDCFETVSRSEHRGVAVGCSLPHDGEVVAEYPVPRSTALPLCQEKVERFVVTTAVATPADARPALLGALPFRCVVLSDSGQLVGSLVSP